MPKALIKEDDYFKVGDEVVLSTVDGELNTSMERWAVGERATVFAIQRANGKSYYTIGFGKEKVGLPGLHNGDDGIGLPDREDRYQVVQRRHITKFEVPKFRVPEREAEYFRKKYFDTFTKSIKVIEVMRRDKETEIANMRLRLNNSVSIPQNSIEWHRAGFIITRFNGTPFITILQKRAIKIDSFVLANFNVKLPENLVYQGNVYLACNFKGSGEFEGFGAYTMRFSPFVSFHTAGERGYVSRVCVGDLAEKPKMDMTEISKALDKYAELLAVVNPHSYLNTGFDRGVSYQRKMDDIYHYIREYSNKYYTEHNICISCFQNRESCRCDVCERCERRYDDCECAVCDSCDTACDTVCDSGYCDNCCGEYHTHCGECGIRMEEGMHLCDECSLCRNCCECNK